MDEIKFDIIEQIGILSASDRGWKKELNYISWNDREPKFDIREWNEDHTRMKKGVTLTGDELKGLEMVIKNLDLEILKEKEEEKVN